MISIIAGPKGTGKTKTIIKMANEEVIDTNGNIIFVDDDKRHIYDLKHALRFISMDEYELRDIDEFYGFICGIISNDYDIDKIYIDGLLKVVDDTNCDKISKFIKKIANVSDRYEIDFVMTISCTKEELSEDVHKYISDEKALVMA